MKTIQYSKFFLGLVLLASMASCVRFERETVPDTTGTLTTLPANAKVVSVDELEGTYPDEFELISQFMEVFGEDTTYYDYYLRLEVLGNDVSGNIYKSMYVSDASDSTAKPEDTRALNLAIDKTNLYNFFPIGQKFYLKCTGLYIGRYNGLPQMGFRYKDDNGSVGLGRIPDEVFMQNTIRDGVAPIDSADMPKPIEITDASQLADRYYNQLVLLRNVEFSPDDIGQEFSPAPPSGSNPTSSDRIFTINGTGSGLTLRTSSACRFFRRPVPAGKGDMLCIYAIYGSTQQFYLRELSDLNLAQFEASAGENVPIYSASFASSLNGFTVHDLKGPATWVWGKYGDGCMMVQGSGSDKSENEDWLISPAITLDTAYTSFNFTFEQALSYKYNSPDSWYSVYISENYESGDPKQAEWTRLSIPNPHEGNNFTFKSSGNINLSEYRGKTIRLAFVYRSDTETMATWEVNKIKILGNK